MVSLPPAVAVAVNPETQTSELIVVVSTDAPSDDNEFELRARVLLLLGSGDTACPLADFARADIAAATAAVTAAEDDDDAETDGRPGSLSSVCARTPARRGSKLPAPPTAGKPNVWLSGLLSAPSLPSTSHVSPRRTAPVVGGELGCGTRPRTSSILDREAPPMPPESGCVRRRHVRALVKC